MSNVSSKQPDKPAVAPAKRSGLPWGPFAAIAVTMLAFVGAQFLSTILLVVAIGATGVGSSDIEDWLRTVTGQFVFVLLSDIFILLGLWLFLRRRKASFKLLGFTRAPAWKDAVYTLLGALAYFAILYATFIFLHFYTQIDLEQQQELGFEGLALSSEKLMALTALVLLPPIVEEIVFRGFLFTGLRKKLRFAWAAVIVSLLFAAPHLLASSEGLLWVAGVDTFMLSLVLCYLREKTGGLWAPIAVHALKNGIAFIFLLSSATTVLY
jgi:membrane protease YdiL (CAAX protease family)